MPKTQSTSGSSKINKLEMEYKRKMAELIKAKQHHLELAREFIQLYIKLRRLKRQTEPVDLHSNYLTTSFASQLIEGNTRKGKKSDSHQYKMLNPKLVVAEKREKYKRKLKQSGK
jgi:hypothetical protein